MFVFVSSPLHNHCSRGRLILSLALLRGGELLSRYIRKRMENGKKTNSGCLGRMINFPERARVSGKTGSCIFYMRVNSSRGELNFQRISLCLSFIRLPLMRRPRHRPLGIFMTLISAVIADGNANDSPGRLSSSHSNHVTSVIKM